MTPAPVIRLHPDDGVLIARSSLPPGMVVADGVTTVERIPAGHKVAIKPIAVGEPVRRYGQIIGFATAPISPGQHVHTQNCGMGDFAKDYAFGVDVKPVPNFDLPATFEGIRRADGRVATPSATTNPGGRLERAISTPSSGCRRMTGVGAICNLLFKRRIASSE